MLERTVSFTIAAKKKNQLSDELSVDEIQDSDNDIIDSLQQQIFVEEYEAFQSRKPASKQSNAFALNTFIDEDGFITIQG